MGEKLEPQNDFYEAKVREKGLASLINESRALDSISEMNF